MTNFDMLATLLTMNAVGKPTSRTTEARDDAAQVDEAACCPPTAPSAAAVTTPLSAPAPANRSQIAGLAEGSGTEALAERLKALADPTRLRMLALLAEHAESLCVCEITPLFELHQPTISHHLRLLREAGLADCERRGTWAYYWATEAGQRALSLVAALT